MDKNRPESTLESALQIRLASESILRESLEEKNARLRDLAEILKQRNLHIQALQEQIRSLRDIVSTHIDPRFWIGFPIGLFDEPRRNDSPERRHNDR